MAQNLGTLNGNLVAQQALPLLITRYPVIKSFCTDFSSEPIHLNQTLVTRIPTVSSLQTYSPVSGYYSVDSTLTDVSVTINQHVFAPVYLTDADLSASQNANLLQTLAESAAESLGAGIMGAIAANFTTGVYNNTPTVQALTGVSRNTILNANTALNKRNVSKDGRFAIVNSDFFGQLKQDPSLVNMFFGGLGISPDGLPIIDGVKVSEYSALPSTNNVQAVVGAKDALVFAARTPSDDGFKDIPLNGRIDVVTDPDTGLSVQVREYYDVVLGKRSCVFAIIFGVGVGNPKSLQLITTS